MFAKLVALSPLPRLSFASLRAPCPTLAKDRRGARGKAYNGLRRFKKVGARLFYDS
jgi:hypothetical protein